MNVLVVAMDVVREAFARKMILALFGAVTLGLLGLLFALDLEVTQGALAAGRLFGKDLDTSIIPVDVAIQHIYQALAYVVFYVGLFFGAVVSGGIAADLLAPGRVEFLLALPIRRTELLLGTYLGVMFIALCGTSLAVFGTTAIIYAKAGVVTPAPLFGAGMAVLSFAPVYALMLLCTVVVRSSVLAIAAGLGLYFGGLFASFPERIGALLEQGLSRDIIEGAMSLLPKFALLGQVAGDAALRNPENPVAAGPLVFGALAFTAAVLALATFWFTGKDY